MKIKENMHLFLPVIVFTAFAIVSFSLRETDERCEGQTKECQKQETIKKEQ